MGDVHVLKDIKILGTFDFLYKSCITVNCFYTVFSDFQLAEFRRVGIKVPRRKLLCRHDLFTGVQLRNIRHGNGGDVVHDADAALFGDQGVRHGLGVAPIEFHLLVLILIPAEAEKT